MNINHKDQLAIIRVKILIVIIFNLILERKGNIRMKFLWIIIKDMVMIKDLTNNLYNFITKIKKDMYQNHQDHIPAIIKLVKSIFNLQI